MKKRLFLLSLIALTHSAFANANELKVDIPSYSCIYSEAELQLLERLSERHQELLKMQAELEAREKAIEEKEKALKNASADLPASSTKRTPEVQIYMQLPASKAASLLAAQTPRKAADILLQMPSAISARLIERMEPMQAQEILKQMSESGEK